jgi:chromosome segregation ATPase
MKRTPNYNLPVVEGTDEYYIDDLNSALQTVDGELSSLSKSVKDVQAQISQAEVMNSDVEIAVARGLFETLAKRLEDIERRLALLETPTP